MKKIALIIGAGPAGLTAAFEMLEKNSGVHPIVLESTDRIGGISCTINHKGNRIDIGGHRFFSKSDVVMDWWAKRMPLQSAPSQDDIALKREKAWAKSGPDPEQEDRVMLIRQRVSRIFYLRNFFDYPISLKLSTILNLGVLRTIYAGFGYIFSQIKKRPTENSLEDFLVNRFGVPLYRMFFENYTEKVWGAHPKKISAEWGAQRIKGLSLSKAVFSALKKIFGAKADVADLRQKGTETSLIEQFFYPKLGPGQLWECVADDIRQMGGEIHMQHKVTEIHLEGERIIGVSAECNGQVVRFDCDYCLSTMPIKDLIKSMVGNNIAADIQRVAKDLPYRDFMTVGVLAKKLKIKNETDIPTVGNIVPDTWIYIQEQDVKLCRLQIFNNWSPYMVENPDNIWVGLEYMCSDQDDIWRMSDEDFIQLAVNELIKIDILDAEDILDTCRIRIEKAYPAYFGTYNEFDKVKNYLDGISNLYCIGRNGQHRYNNQDHSMLTAIEAVNCIMDSSRPRSELWSINSEQEYHESKKSSG